MSNTFLSVIIGMFMVAGIGGFVYWQKASLEEFDQNLVENALGDGASGIPASVTSISYDEEDEEEDESLDDGQTINSPVVPTSQSSDTGGQTAGITAAQVAQHNSRTSCWSTINGNVYDLTSWIPKHPGGEQNILRLCGINGSILFNGQHGGSQKPAAMLSGFKIGVAAN